MYNKRYCKDDRRVVERTQELPKKSWSCDDRLIVADLSKSQNESRHRFNLCFMLTQRKDKKLFMYGAVEQEWLLLVSVYVYFIAVLNEQLQTRCIAS